MLNHFGYQDDFNGGCQPDMDYLTCGNWQTKVYGFTNNVTISYVRTIDAGPNLLLLCNQHNPKLLIHLTPGAFSNGLGVPLSQGTEVTVVYQP